MKKIDVSVTEHMYDVLKERYKSRKRIEEIVSLKLERKLIDAYNNERFKEYKPRETLTILIEENLYTRFNAFCVKRNISKREFIMKILNRLIE